jgi:hypothetical protein
LASRATTQEMLIFKASSRKAPQIIVVAMLADLLATLIVLAREFVVERHRANLPQVPACEVCNGKKAKLEHHLTAVMPIGARHENKADVRDGVHRRLAKNAPLARQVTRWLEPRWMMSPAGLLELTSVAPVDANALLR